MAIGLCTAITRHAIGDRGRETYETRDTTHGTRDAGQTWDTGQATRNTGRGTENRRFTGCDRRDRRYIYRRQEARDTGHEIETLDREIRGARHEMRRRCHEIQDTNDIQMIYKLLGKRRYELRYMEHEIGDTKEEKRDANKEIRTKR